MLNEVARRLLAIRFDTLPKVAVATAVDAILDTVGVTLAGAPEPAALAARAALVAGGGSSGAATLFGLPDTAGVLDAALANGTASHALDFDDCSNTLGGHPSAPIIPALWALAEAEGGTGRALIAAYVAGFEVETRIGRAVNFHHYEKGWHPTATLGIFGAAAASAHLMRLDAERTAMALALAATMSSGLKANFGTMAKPFHVGHCARNGLFAALLAREGMTANPEALTHPQGFFEVLNSPGTYAPERVLEQFADPLDIVETGVAFKRHPCCASTHPAIDALLALRADQGLTADDVSHVLSWTHPRRLRHTNRPSPSSGLDAKFSVQYVLARALRHGIVSLDHFSDVAMADPATRDLMARITAEPHPEARMDTTEHFFGEVTLTLADGRVLRHRVERPVGRDRDHPLPPGALHAKFRDCAGRSLDTDRTDRLLAALVALPDLPRIADLSDLLRAPRPGLSRRAAL
ncbi:MmgE/PrpD family protein [Silicimonas algicola]|uniref:2-methylcitrate dehydratase PrpD n=1 Tax=Silicimonas algicola TaxID=1826607 RepID=A0A316G1T7_9RHOB|nr:MmgE/PrpD family protein [Silicimonas algicola]AZQ68271.1 MmgE/PrpD family protein [Silicimonas algicola]PWK54593.1 2-methylcitrate dehydratase PrpD [Silicimonas algicola]